MHSKRQRYYQRKTHVKKRTGDGVRVVGVDLVAPEVAAFDARVASGQVLVWYLHVKGAVDAVGKAGKKVEWVIQKRAYGGWLKRSLAFR